MVAITHGVPLSWILGAAYVVAGVALAVWLHRHGHPSPTTASALVVWPLLLPLAAGARPAAIPEVGPSADRIRGRLDGLRDALGDPAVAGLIAADDLLGLERTLLAADARVGRVDRILRSATSTDDAVRRSADRLATARGRAAAEIEAVLSELEQLRLHAALMVLSGDSTALRERVGSLVQRARAIEEVAALDALPR